MSSIWRCSRLLSKAVSSAPSLIRGFARDSRGYEHFEGRAHWGGFATSPTFSSRGKWVVGAAVGAGAAYYVSSIEEVPYVKRRHAVMFVTQTYEKQLGSTMFEQEKAEAVKARTLLPDNHPQVLLVRRIGEKIARVAGDGFGGGKYDHMKGLDWEFIVIQSPVPNAFVLPGGKVVVYTGLINLLAGEAELAAVMAHEVSHVLARHSAERMSTLGLIAIGRMLFYMMVGVSFPALATQLGIFLPFSRRAESEADMIGLRLMARACYDPGAAMTMLGKLNALEQATQQKSSKVMDLLRTHPLSSARVEAVKRELPEAYQLFQGSAECSAYQERMRRATALLTPHVHFEW